MDAGRFDHLLRSLSTASSRRAALLTLIGAALGGRLPFVAAPAAARSGGKGKDKNKKRKKKRNKNEESCPGCYIGDLCQEGIFFNACGGGGADCENCRDQYKECAARPLGDGGDCICSTRSCAQRLDSQGRGGCCTVLNGEDGACESGTADAACGERGNQCVNCDAQSKKCDAATRGCCIAANDRGCGANEPCCGGLSCISGRCLAGSSCSHADGPCGSGRTCCDGEVLECRSGRCCALNFGYCQVDGDCCNPDHTCVGASCQ